MLRLWYCDNWSNTKDSANGLFLPACDLYHGYRQLSWKQQWKQPAMGKKTAEGLGEQPAAAPEAQWRVSGKGDGGRRRWKARVGRRKAVKGEK